MSGRALGGVAPDGRLVLTPDLLRNVWRLPELANVVYVVSDLGFFP